MSAPTPNVAKDSIVSFTIKSNGSPICDTIEVTAIEISSGINRIPSARLTMFDGNATTEDFPISASSTFVPGAKINICLGYSVEKETLVFSGIVVRQKIEISPNDPSVLIVEAYDKALAMTLERRYQQFEDVTDSGLIKQLIERNGLTARVEATNTTKPKIIQNFVSDWALMLDRADANGMVAIVENAKVDVQLPDTSAAPVLQFVYGDNVHELSATMDASTQFSAGAIESFSFDTEQQKLVSASATGTQIAEPGNLSSNTLAQVFAIKSDARKLADDLDDAELQSCSNSRLARSVLSKITGRVTFQGSTLAKAGKMIELGGLGGRFNGNCYIGSVEHVVGEGQWLTHVEFGLSSTPQDL